MIQIADLRREYLDALKDLFAGFPYKNLQQKKQGLAVNLLASNFVEQAETRSNSISPPQQWVALENGTVTAYAALLDDRWHGEVYGKPFGKISPFLAYAASESARVALLEKVLAEADARGFRHLSVRVDGSEYDLVRLFCGAGFYLVDNSVKMWAPSSALPRLDRPAAARGMELRLFDQADLEGVMEIAASGHPLNHYLNDPHLPAEQTATLFAGWVRRCALDLPNATVFVLERGGACMGFVIYLDPVALNRQMSLNLVILDFVCLHREARGGGLGRWLITESLHRLPAQPDQVELRTSQNNYPALQCYGDLGLHVLSTDFILHGERIH